MGRTNKISQENYCDKEFRGQADPFFRLCTHGRAIFCGAAYPTEDSRSHAACERALEIACGSFLRRPSLCDEAVGTIAGFINEGLYALQEPGKHFLCSLAILYAFQGKARWMVSGDACVFHFQDGKLAGESKDCKEPLLGRQVCWDEEAEPEFDVSRGTHAFLLCSGAGGADFGEIVQKVPKQSPEGDEAWLQQVMAQFQGEACCAAAFILPERKGRWPGRDKA